MKRFITHPFFEPIRPRRDTIEALEAYINTEIEDIINGRFQIERAWADNLRQYEAIPKQAIKNVPIVNAPNIEVPIGAVAVDVFYSMSLRQTYAINPIIKASAAPSNGQFIEEAKDIQQFAEWGIRNEFMLREASDHSFLDTIQLGTGCYYIPWIEEVRKTRSRKIISRRPVVRPWPIEDVFIPGGAFQGIEDQRLVGLRYYLDTWSLHEHAKLFKWDISMAQPLAQLGWVRSSRERIGRTSSVIRQGNLFEIFDIYLYWDIDNDGIREDLLITWDRTSRKALKVRYNPYDHRPIEVMHYQKRAHLFYGVGILEKLRPLQNEASDIHNHRNLNMLLANTRFWKVKRGTVAQNFKLWPNRMMVVDDPNDVQGEAMADIYNSSQVAESQTMQLAERLVGINEMASPRPSQILGSRTPGVTTLALLQQSNQRFAAAFDSMRFATGGAVKQCLYRYQERILMGDTEVGNHILRVMGPEKGRRIIQIMRSEQFDDGIQVELATTGERTSRDAERQALIQIAGIWTTYAERTIQLGTIAANPQVPPGVREIAKKISRAAGELMERISISFDNIKDPKAFVMDIEADIDQIGQSADRNNLAALQNLVGALDAQNSRLLPEGQNI